MEIFYSGYKPQEVKFEWKITRGKTNVKEDFGNAMVWAFLTGEGGMRYIDVSVEDNILKGDIPISGLDVGVYGLKLIWVKDAKHYNLNERAFGEDNVPVSAAELLAFNKCCYSEIYELFGITPSQYADTNMNGSVTFHLCSSAATYGNDGLSAYESAYLLGLTTDTEEEWLKVQSTIEAGEGYSSVQQKGGAEATGDYSFATGWKTEASGLSSFAAGSLSKAEASYSVSFGMSAEASSVGETALGIYNEPKTEEGNNTIFTIGVGSPIKRKNAIEIWRDGKVWFTINKERECLQDWIKILDKLCSVLIDKNVIDDDDLNITSEEVGVSPASTYLGSSAEVVAANTESETEQLVEEDKRSQAGQPSDYYAGVIIGHFD